MRAVVSSDEMALMVRPLTSSGVSMGSPKLNRCRRDSGNRTRPVIPEPSKPLKSLVVIDSSRSAAVTWSSDSKRNGA